MYVKTSLGPPFSDFAPLRVALCREGGTLVAMVRECWHQLRLAGCVKERDHMIKQLPDYSRAQKQQHSRSGFSLK